MTDDKKTLKFQMMMSPKEAAVLDDWMFTNRIRSRAEAIRRLCQVGLAAESMSDSIQSRAKKIDQLIWKLPDKHSMLRSDDGTPLAILMSELLINISVLSDIIERMKTEDAATLGNIVEIKERMIGEYKRIFETKRDGEEEGAT